MKILAIAFVLLMLYNIDIATLVTGVFTVIFVALSTVFIRKELGR